MVETKEKESKAIWELAEIPTQTAIVIKNNSTGDIMNEIQALLMILNKLEKLEKALI